MMTRHQAKRHLEKLGISQRSIAPQLGVRFEHLNRVLNGHRHSRRLLALIARLGPAHTSTPNHPNP
jgi:transcriptional regulator with XRE-family HTH domain